MTDFNLAKKILNTDGFLECYKMKAFWSRSADEALLLGHVEPPPIHSSPNQRPTATFT